MCPVSCKPPILLAKSTGAKADRTLCLPNRNCCSLCYTEQRTSSVHQSASSAVDIFSSSQEIPLILVNLNVHYCNHKSPLTTCARCALRYRLVSSGANTGAVASVALTARNGNATGHIWILWELPRRNLIWAFNFLDDEWPAVRVTSGTVCLEQRSVGRSSTKYAYTVTAGVPEEVSCAEHKTSVLQGPQQYQKLYSIQGTG